MTIWKTLYIHKSETEREQELLYRPISAWVAGRPLRPGTHFAVDWPGIIKFPHLSSWPLPLRKINNYHLQFQFHSNAWLWYNKK